jgi:hypothetical protein
VRRVKTPCNNRYQYWNEMAEEDDACLTDGLTGCFVRPARYDGMLRDIYSVKSARQYYLHRDSRAAIHVQVPYLLTMLLLP